VKLYDLIEKASGFTIGNLNRNYWPQLSVSGKATYQSDVTATPFYTPPKDQYQLVAEFSQILWDGGETAARKRIETSTATMERNKLEVELYALNERVDQLFFGILLLESQIVQIDILREELGVNADRVKTYIANGIANQTDLDAIRVEEVNARQRSISLHSSLGSFRDMLDLFIGEPIDDNTVLIQPSEDLPKSVPDPIHLPELALLEAQGKVLVERELAVKASAMPKLSVFAQGLFGQPGLDAMEDGPTINGLVGMRVSWSTGSLYMKDNSLKALGVEKRKIDVQKEVFLFNKTIEMEKLMDEIGYLRDLIGGDAELIELRGRLKKAAEAKLENGTISVTDLLREMDAESLAKQEKLLHEIQLQMAVRKLRTAAND
jgi:outer membrane protein TolC